MFDLDKSVAAWRRTLEHNPSLSGEDVAELVQHLRDEVAGLVAEGLGAEAAFGRAMALMGDYATAEREYGKVYWGKLKRRRLLADELTWRMSMFENYAKTALRSLLRQKGYTVLNLAGLTLGMACCLLIFQYVAYETSFDAFNTKKDRIYRATFEQTQNGEEQDFQTTHGYILGPTMAQEVPGIVRYVRIHPNYGDAVISYEGPAGVRTFKEERVFFVDSTFLSTFDYPLVEGDPRSALRQPETILVSESMARKYFGAEEAVGKTLQFTGWVSAPYTVAGVFADVPPTSHLQFDFLLPMEDLLAGGRFERGGAPWGWQNFPTYLELAEHADVAAVEDKITDLYMTYRRDEFTASRTWATAYLQPLTDIHLNKAIGGLAVRGDRNVVYFFTVVGLITLVIALVNYVNLATARAMDRAKEVGVRKVVGAQKRQLVAQFLMESALTNVLALVLALGLSLVLLPEVNRVAGVALTARRWLDGRFWGVFAGILGAGVLLSGLYPAFVLSSFRPVTVLKGRVDAVASRVTLRKVLVVIQFAASIALLAGTVVVYAQLRYLRSLDTGFDLARILVVEEPKVRPEGGDRGAEMASLKDELEKLPAVQAAGLSATTPGRGFYWHTQMYRSTADPSTVQRIAATLIDHDFADVYGLELAAGEAFHAGTTAPDDGPAPVMVNETMVRAFGFASNDAALGEEITNGDGASQVIIGVFKDFQWSSAHQETELVMFQYDPGIGNISMKVNTTDLPGTIAAVEQTYRTFFPGNPFNYYFADAAFDEQYRSDRRFAGLFAGFAGVAIVIACLGLFGLASFTAARRTKEVGVRKVLGASVEAIVALLTKDFVVLVGIAFVIATPAAYLYMNTWLEGFARRIELGAGVFLLAGGMALAIALVTVGYHAVRAALADPVRSLRYE